MLYPLSYGGSPAVTGRPGVCAEVSRSPGTGDRPHLVAQAVGRPLRFDSRNVTGALVALLDR
jgi:hypothetical protein